MDYETQGQITFGSQGDTVTVSRGGEPAGEIRKFTKFECGAWTYEEGSLSLVGPLPEVQNTIKRSATRPA